MVRKDWYSLLELQKILANINGLGLPILKEVGYTSAFTMRYLNMFGFVYTTFIKYRDK